MPRKYTKRSDYWEKFEKPEGVLSNLASSGTEPEMIGENLLSSVASSRLRGSSSSQTRQNIGATNTLAGRYSNIAEGILPYAYSDDSVSANEAIILTQKAYFNIPVFKATIDLMSEFSDSPLYLKGGTKKSKDFIMAWWKKIKVNGLKEQFFREFYRSGNVFLQRLEAELTTAGIKSSVAKYGISNAGKLKVPIKYVMLNPAEIGARGALYFGEGSYVKFLTNYEILRLKEPVTEEDKLLYKSLPEEVQKAIKRGGATTNTEIHLPLDMERTHAIFYKKQDYEPLAIPMGFCVLDDINRKIEMKKVDQAIVRSIENVILLVTMGTDPDKGGINRKNIETMQTIFMNKSVGRVLVADYTTKAEFIIPDMKKVLGKEKYEVLNDDIREGLQNIMLGDSKYSDAQLKLRVFFQRLDEARGVFLRDFLQPEIKRICKDAGLRNPPEAKFAKLDTMDNAALQKLVTRLVELGILTPEQGLTVINTGVFPDASELEEAQEKFKEQREKEYFIPLTNNINLLQIDSQEEMQEEQLKNAEKIAKTKPAVSTQKPNTGRPTGTSEQNRGERSKAFSVQSIMQVAKDLESLVSEASQLYQTKMKTDKLSTTQATTIQDICIKVVSCANKEDWLHEVEEVCVDPQRLLHLEVNDEIAQIANEHMLDDYSAAILYHSLQ